MEGPLRNWNKSFSPIEKGRHGSEIYKLLKYHPSSYESFIYWRGRLSTTREALSVRKRAWQARVLKIVDEMFGGEEEDTGG